MFTRKFVKISLERANIRSEIVSIYLKGSRVNSSPSLRHSRQKSIEVKLNQSHARIWQDYVSMLNTYIHNWSLQRFSQDYGLASHTTHAVCVNFIRNWGDDLHFNVDSERQIFQKLFHGRSIHSQSFCQKSVERKSPKKYFSHFIFDDWPGIRTQAFASN